MKSLRNVNPAVGIWLSLASAYSAEIIADSDLDWLLIDAEHAPNSLQSVLAQLQSTASHKPDIVVRAPCDARWVLNQYLDIGVLNLMVPMIDTPRQAKELVKSVRYPPAGVRGVATSTSRAARFGHRSDYFAKADDEIFLIAQIETPLAVSHASAIAQTPGIDALFIGPADLSANLGYLGMMDAPEVQESIKMCINAGASAHVPVGIICGSTAAAKNYVGMGAKFVAVGSDIGLLRAGVGQLVQAAGNISPEQPGFGS